MTWLRAFASRLFDPLIRTRRERQLTTEIQAHLDDLVEDFIARGLSPREAAAAAKRTFGAVEPIKETYRDQRGIPMFDAVRLDLRHALQSIVNARGASLIAIVVLAFGLAVSNAAFTIANAVCLRGLPIERADRVLSLAAQDARALTTGLSYQEFQDLRRVSTVFDDVGAYTSAGPVVISEEQLPAERLAGTYISSGAFRILGESPVRGREFRPADDEAGAPLVVVLGAAVWRSRYEAQDSIVGRAIDVDGAPAVVVGVMRDGFRFPANAEVWFPIGKMPGAKKGHAGERTLEAFGRLHDGASRTGATAELDAIGRNLAVRSPQTNEGVRFVATPINDEFNGDIGDPVWIAFLTAGFIVFLVSCANAANLILMRGAARRREIAVRASMGATRGRIVRMLLMESALLASVAAALGVLLSTAAVRLLAASVPQGAPLPYWIEFTIDDRVMLVLVALLVGSIVFCGLMPALRASQARIGSELQRSVRGVTLRRRTRRLTTGLLACEFGLSLVLLVPVGRGFGWFDGQTRNDLSLEESEVVSASVTLPAARYPSPEQRRAFFDDVLAKLDAAGVAGSATVTSHVPVVGGATAQPLRAAAGARFDSADVMVQTVAIGPGYFDTLEVPLLKGRDFGALDGAPDEATSIVNKRFEERYFSSGDALGQTIEIGRPEPAHPPTRLTIVGVVPNVQHQQTDDDAMVYLPVLADPPATAVVLVRASADKSAMVAPALREQIREIDPGVPIHHAATIKQTILDATWNGRVSRRMVETVSVVALLLTLAGLYAVTAYAVTEQRDEFSVRIALGASRLRIAWMVLRRGLLQLWLGLVVGGVLVFAFSRLVFSTASTGESGDWRPMFLSVAVLSVLSVMACVAPALRACRRDPASTLRA